MVRKSLILLTSLLIFALQSCGGGGGGGSGDGPSSSKSLKWTPPSTREDGGFLSLSSIAGYRIYFGTDENNLHQVVDIEDMSVNSYTYEAPDSGGYYFAVTAYDTHDQESEMSNIVVK